MNIWMKRFSILFIVVLWLLAMSIPFFMFSLASNGELQVGEQPGNEVRVFLLQDRDAEGIGAEWSRPRSFDSLQCTQTSVRYYMWVGDPENVTYCQCQDSDGNPLPATATACEAP